MNVDGMSIFEKKIFKNVKHHVAINWQRLKMRNMVLKVKMSSSEC